MPIFFLIVGIMLIIVGVNNRLGELGGLIKEDFVPSDGAIGFPIWIVAIFAIGSLGYVRSLKPVSNAFLVLVMIGLILSNRGFFARFNEAVRGLR